MLRIEGDSSPLCIWWLDSLSGCLSVSRTLVDLLRGLVRCIIKYEALRTHEIFKVCSQHTARNVFRAVECFVLRCF
jgi:hypothetical protein